MWVIKLRRMRWEEHVAGYGGWERCIQVLGGNLREMGHLEDSGVNEIILRWIFRKQNVRAWT
jgi:hypothetical protein